MEPRTRKITSRIAGVSAALAFVSQPVPGLDELIVVPFNYWLCVRIARQRGVPLRSLPWVPIKKIIWYGAAARLVANFTLGLVPVVGMFSNAITAVALTEYLGRYLDEVIASGVTEGRGKPPPDITMDGLKELFREALAKRERK